MLYTITAAIIGNFRVLFCAAKGSVCLLAFSVSSFWPFLSPTARYRLMLLMLAR